MHKCYKINNVNVMNREQDLSFFSNNNKIYIYMNIRSVDADVTHILNVSKCIKFNSHFTSLYKIYTHTILFII